ncbi:DUF2865 domain-containing protein [Rhizobium herbae]|jgi:hypothetical protein
MSGFTEIAGRIGRMGTTVVAAVLTLTIHVSGVQAGNCAPARASGSPEISRLQRQIAANRAFQVKYSCDAKATFACREIAGRIAQTNARIASLSGASQQVCARQAVAERAPAGRSVAAASRSATAGYALRRISAKIETRCVRLSDGYSFPTPNSGYNTTSDMEAIAAQCKFICDDPAMDVYRITSADRNTDEMISVTTGARYAELPNAGTYRTASPLKTCDMNRFYKTVLAKTPAAADAPISNVENVQPVEALNVALLEDVGLRGTASFVQPQTRKVRIVGAAYLPDN